MQATHEECWQPIPGYEGYEVSDLGRLRSLDRIIWTTRGPRRLNGRVLRLWPGKYLGAVITIAGEGHTLTAHRSVAAAFLGPCPEGMEVCHNNGDRHDNRVANLRYDTSSANHRDTVRHGRHHFAVRTHCDQGHEFTPQNTAVRSDCPGARRCRTCDNERRRQRAAA